MSGHLMSYLFKMRRLKIIVLFCVAIGAAVLAVVLALHPAKAIAEQNAEAPLPPLPADCMPSTEVKPGMIGVGKTVFQGYKPGEFKAEILGVQRSVMAHG